MSILIDADSTFIIQGITGREAVTMTRELLDYGSKVVGGVTPGRKGRDVHGVPVEDTVRAFTERERVEGAIIGSTYAELMPLFEADPETRGIAIYSEPGGRSEAELADYMQRANSRLPVVAFMAGRFMDAMPGVRFGHAGTIVEGRADTTADKIARMQTAGIAVAERIEEIPALLKQRVGAAK